MNDDKENHNSISTSQFLNKMISFRGTFIKHFIVWQDVAITLGVKCTRFSKQFRASNTWEISLITLTVITNV